MTKVFVSVILAVRNEEENIKRILEQVFNQTYPRDQLEVIVVDGKSSDKTADIAESYICPERALKVIRLLDLGRSQGLNKGIREAKGGVILRVDARTSIPEDYILRCVETLEVAGADNVGGVQKPIANSITQEAIGLALSHPFGVGNSQFRIGRKSGFVDSVYLGCFKRNIFDRVGFFDEGSAVISEDSDINQRIREAGGKVYLNKDIFAHYYPRERFVDFWKLYYRYGGARAGNLLKHGNLTSWRQIVAPLFILAIASSALLSLFIDHRFILLFGAILGTYLTVNVLVSFAVGFRLRKLHLTPLLVCAFACMHFGWALGFWHRLIVPMRPGRYWAN